MPWTTPETAVAGNVLTAAYLNTNVRDNTSFLFTPPSVRVHRTSNLTGYSSDAAITWSAEEWDTDGMWSSGSTITIQTAGLYLINFAGRAGGSATISRIQPHVKNAGSALSATDYVVTDSGTFSQFNLSIVRKLAAGATITATVVFVGGSAYAITGDATVGSNLNTGLTVQWVGNP
jgi:hypothetical protein